MVKKSLFITIMCIMVLQIIVFANSSEDEFMKSYNDYWNNFYKEQGYSSYEEYAADYYNRLEGKHKEDSENDELERLYYDKNGELTDTSKEVWYKANSEAWFYYKNGKQVKNNWIYDNGKYYYFDSSGYMLNGISKVINGEKYFFNQDGSLKTDTVSGDYVIGSDGRAINIYKKLLVENLISLGCPEGYAKVIDSSVEDLITLTDTYNYCIKEKDFATAKNCQLRLNSYIEQLVLNGQIYELSTSKVDEFVSFSMSYYRKQRGY